MKKEEEYQAVIIDVISEENLKEALREYISKGWEIISRTELKNGTYKGAMKRELFEE